MINTFIKELAESICKKYKVDFENAKKYISEDLEKEHSLMENIKKTTDLNQLKKTKNYKTFVKKIKKKIYYDLRTYQKEKATSLENTHISTSERAPYVSNLLEQIDPYISDARSVIDVGGGIFRITFDFKKYNKINRFVWIDKDEISYNKLQDFKAKNHLDRLILFHEKIGEHPWAHYLEANQDESLFDFALYLKLIPVIYRQDRELLMYLADIPAKTVLITGSKEAMVKKQNIEKRESKILKNFINQSGREIISKIDVQNEFGYIIR